MLEIKSYDDWLETTGEISDNPVGTLQKYTDYVRSSYFKSGALTRELEAEIIAGAQDRLVQDGLITEETQEQEANDLLVSVAGGSSDKSSDARFVLEYLKDTDPTYYAPQIQGLTNFLMLKDSLPDRAEEFRSVFDEVVGDRDLVRESRIAAADRGDYSVVSVEETDGSRSLYTGPTARPDRVSGEIDTLLKSGAITSSDLFAVNDVVRPLNGGLSNASEVARFEMFKRTVDDIAKKDKDINSLLDRKATSTRQALESSQRTTGETILQGAKTAIAYPFEKVGEAVMGTARFFTGEEKEEPRYSDDTNISDVLSSDPNLLRKFSAEEIEKFSDALVAATAGPVYRADRPETGIGTDSMGNPLVATALLPNDELFEKALEKAPLNEEQKKFATATRNALLRQTTPDILKIILEEDADAATAHALAKAQGKSDTDFVKDWVGDPSNYSGFSTRLEQFGKSTWKTLAEIPLGIAALSGNEWAVNQMGKMLDDQARRTEYARLFGDEFGLGFEIINTIPQVATDIGLTIGTGAAFAGAKTLARAGATSGRTSLRTMARLSLAQVDETATNTYRAAVAAGGEASTGAAIREVGRSLSSKFGAYAPVFAVSFTRSASATYGSIYNQLPDDMGHEEKHKNSLGYALAAGLSTGVIVTGMSLLGRGAVEDIATNRVRAMLAGETDDAIRAANGRVVPVDKMNYRQAKAVYENLYNEAKVVKDATFQRALRGAVGSTYKNYLRTTFGGVLNEAVEEALDQAIQIKIEDAALDRETPLAERLNQIFTAGVIGGALGGLTAGVGQLGSERRSEAALVYEGRASALENVAKRLRETNSNATAETVQRIIDEARARAAQVTEQQNARAARQRTAPARTEEEPNPYDRPLRVDAEGQGLLPMDVPQEVRERKSLLVDAVGDRAQVGGYSGVLETTEDGMEVRLALDEVRGDGVTHINVGPRLMPLSQSGVSLNRNGLTVLGTDVGGIKAGTPYVIPDPKTKTKFALPETAESLVVLPSLGGVDAVLIRNARMVGQENVSRDVILTDPDQIEDALAYYKLDPRMVAEYDPMSGQLELDLWNQTTEVLAPEEYTQMELDLFPATPTPQVDAEGQLQLDLGDTPVETVPETVPEVPPARTPRQVSEVIQEARDIVRANPLAAELRQIAKAGFSPEGIQRVSSSYSAEQVADMQSRLRQVTEFATALDEANAKDRKSILDSAEFLSAVLDRVVTATAVPPVPVATTPETPPETPDAKAKKAPTKRARKKGDKKPVTPVEDTTVEDDPQDPAETVTDLQQQRMEAEQAKRVPAMMKGSPPMTVAEAEVVYKAASKKVAQLKKAKATVPKTLNKFLVKLMDDIIKGKQQLAQELQAIDAKIQEIQQPDEPVDSAQKELEKFLMGIIGGAKPPATPTKNDNKGVKITPLKWTKTKNGVFRNKTEAQLFADFVSGGYLISNLAEFGFLPKKLGKDSIALNTPRAEGMPAYQVEVKQRLYEAVRKAFPFVDPPDSGIVEVTSKTPWGNMDSSGSSYLKLPMIPDSEGKPIRGFFTNNPRVTAAQKDWGVNVFVPMELLNDPSFVQNPSIAIDPKSGRVKSVKLHPMDTGVFGAGGVSFVGTGTAASRGGRKNRNLLGSSLVEPAARYLSGAGNSPRNRSAESSTFETFLNDAVSMSSLYQDMRSNTLVQQQVSDAQNRLDQVSKEIADLQKTKQVSEAQNKLDQVSKQIADLKKSKTRVPKDLNELKSKLENDYAELQKSTRAPRDLIELRSRLERDIEELQKSDMPTPFGKLLLRRFNLTLNRAENAMSEALIEYSNSLKEYGLAKKIDAVLARALVAKPDATLGDINVYDIVRKSMVDASGQQLNPRAAADILRANGYKGESASQILTNYGVALHGRLTEGDYSSGVEGFARLVVKAGERQVEIQKRRGELDREMKTISIEGAQAESFEGSSSAFDALSGLIASEEDVRATVIAAEESAYSQLVTDLTENDDIYELLHEIVRKGGVPDLSPNIDAEDLIDIAGRAIAWESVPNRREISERLSKTPEGVKLANRMLMLGWLPRGLGRVLSPQETSFITSTQRAGVMSEATQASELQENIRALNRLLNETRGDVLLSVSEDNAMLAEEARKVNRQDIERLGLRSNDPESVIDALETIQESGLPKYRRVASLLLQFPEIIRNVRFHIGDFNDVRFAGAFSNKSNLVVLNLSGHNGRGITDVFLHEMLHASTFNLMSNPRTISQQRALSRISSIRRLVQAQAVRMNLDNQQLQDALNDDVEFLAYALTDTAFQSLISSVTPPQQRSILRRIVDAILGFFNIDRATPDLAGPIEELIDFAQMFANDLTYNIRQRGITQTKGQDIADAVEEVREAYSAIELRLRSRSDTRFAQFGPAQIDADYLAAVEAAKSKQITEDEMMLLQAELEAELYAESEGLSEEERADLVDQLTEEQVVLSVREEYEPSSVAEEDVGMDEEDVGARIPVEEGWLYKNGKFFSTAWSADGGTEGRGHRIGFIYILKKYHPKETADFLLENGMMDVSEMTDGGMYALAYKLGYARIVPYEDDIMVEYGGELTSRQRDALKEASQEAKANVVRDFRRNTPSSLGDQTRVLFSAPSAPSAAAETKTTKTPSIVTAAYIEQERRRIREKLERRSRGESFHSVALEKSRAAGGVVAIDAVEELSLIMPDGFDLVVDPTLNGEASTRRGSRTITVNPAMLDRRIAGFSPRQARLAVRSLLNHELAHVEAANTLSDTDISAITTALGSTKLQEIAEDYYSLTGQTYQETVERVAADRASGVLTDARIVDEWVRMTVTKAATGFTYEEDIRFLSKNPSLLDTVIRVIQSYVNRLKQLFAEYPTSEVAAMVSKASRNFRRLQKVGTSSVEPDLMEEATFGDSEKFLAALDGTLDGDRVMYSIPVVSSDPQKVDTFMERLESKLYNLPAVLRDVVNMRSGTVNTISTSMRDFIKDFPKMRDAALKEGAAIEDIKILFGTTAPPITKEALQNINAQVDSFEASLDRTSLTDEQAEARVENFREDLKRQERLRFNTEFRLQQQAVEVAMTEAGFGGLVQKAIALRNDINKFKTNIGFDASNDVYLTRAYRFFTTEGWAMAARHGGTITIDGQQVDFNKMRSVAAEAYYEQAEAALQKSGRPYTADDVNERTLEMLDNYLMTLESLSKSTDRIAVDSIRQDLNRLKPKKDIDSAFRDILGEIDDPMATAANTLFRVGMMSANQDFRNNFAKVALDTGLASKTPKPDFIKWRSESSFATMGPLAGLWFDPAVAGVLDEAFGINMATHMANSTKMMNKIGRVISRVSGVAVQAKTQLGIGYWPRNSVGGFLLGSAQGIFMNPLSKAGRESIVQSARGAFSRLPTEEEQRNQILRLIQLNVLSDQSQGRIVQDMLRGLVATPEQELLELISDIEEARATQNAGGVLERMKQKGTIKGVLDLMGSKYRTATDKLAALDGLIDGMHKVNAYYFERGVIDRHYGNTLSEEQKDEEAARKVKLTFAGHSQVVDIVQSFNRTPLATIFLPFARWKSEVFRTMLNTIPLAMKEIKEGGVMKRRGIRRLIGFLGTLTVAPVALGTFATIVFRALAGEDEEEESKMLDVYEKAALKEALPLWQRGHSLYAQVVGGDRIQYIDMTYILPHSQLTDMVNIISDGIRTGRGIEASNLASYVVNDLIGLQIAATSAGELMSNRDDFGRPIYVETDPAPVKMWRMLSHFGRNAVAPASVLKLNEAFRTGQQNTKEILIGEALGARPRTLTFGDVERRAFRNLKAVQDTSVSIVGELFSGRYQSQEDVDKVINRHQDAMNQTQARMSAFIRTMSGLGSPNESIAASAKAFNFSDDTIRSAYDGYRIAWRPAQAWFQKVYANTLQSEEQDPDERINMIIKAVDRKPDVYWVNGQGE